MMSGRAVIYARFSCSKQREASIDDQLRVCREWCAREGFDVVGEYCDHAISGRTDDRPQFQLMMDRAGESDIVLVYMMDRFSRDAYDAPLYKKRLRERGVRVVSATEAIPEGAEAILIEKIYEGLAAVESAHIAERTRRGMEGNALKCMHNGVRVFGYSFGEDGRYVVTPDEAEVVRECFARKIAGEAVTSIARDLAARGVRTYAGNPAGYTFVYNMIRNEKYAGVYSWGDVRVDDGMPQIIGRDEFDLAQTVRPRKVRDHEDWGSFPLSGKAVCSCGRNLIGVSGRGRGNVKYEYYRCGERCGVSPARADWIEGAVVDAIRSLLGDRDTAMAIARAVERHLSLSDVNRRADAARRRREEAERGIGRLMDSIAAGIDPALVKAKVDELRASAEAATAEIAALEGARRFDIEDFCDFLQFGATLDDAHLLDAFVWQVILGEEDVTVVLNYDVKKNEPARLSLERVRTDSVWLPIGKSTRTVGIAVSTGTVLLRFPRAA